MTEQEAIRKNRVAAESAAWADLATNEAFQTVLQEAQVRFGMLEPSFQVKDGYNTHGAAFRDGQKDVLKDFAKRLGLGRMRLEDEETPPRPTQAS